MRRTRQLRRMHAPTVHVRLLLLHYLLFILSAAGFVPIQVPFHRLSRTTSESPTLLRSNANNEQTGDDIPQDDEMVESFYIRKALYSDLGDVADIVMSSFYSGNNAQAPWRHLFRLGELNRLQQNFPYSDSLHYMYVASSKSMEQVIAFVDIDARPPKQANDPPRPYLSDLCVHPKWRRRGVAKMLVQKCEDVAMSSMKKEELYIRVEQNNTSAIGMYENLKYKRQSHHYFGVKDTTMLLHKRLIDDETIDHDQNETVLNGTQISKEALDYIV